MSEEIQITITPRAQAALDELQAMIARRYPEATFDVHTGYDPAGIYLLATIDIEDIDEVVDVFMDRMLEMQIEEGLPVYVVPLRPVARALAELREHYERLFPPLPRTG
ncbi:MAG: hypothetical protein IT338_19170 [Thermomicrobiales bacterium]|nr:hypothetical protein [Thermomicrobiales bacterium]